MKKYLFLVFAIGTLISCSSAKMVVAPELQNNSYSYKITEKPGFTGDKIRFGSYLASNIDRDFTRGSGATIFSYKKESKSQDYRYNFSGNSNWKAECNMSGQKQTLGSVSFGMEKELNCSFTSIGSNRAAFKFKLSGTSLMDAMGTFLAGSKEFRVSVVNKIQGSSFSLGVPSGYYFYSGNKLVASVDSINSKGPILFSKNLSTAEKDRVGLVMVALLLAR